MTDTSFYSICVVIVDSTFYSIFLVEPTRLFLQCIFAGDLAAVRIIGVSVIAGCPQGEN